MNIQHNIGNVDRLVRAVLGAALIGAAAGGLLTAMVGTLVAAVGAVFLVTAAVRFCPLYRAFGLSSCERTLRPR